MIIPSSNYNLSKTVSFTDYYSDSSTSTYQYFTKYYTTSGYVTSKASEEFSGKTSGGEKAISLNSVTSTTLTYDTTTCVLSITAADITVPTDHNSAAFTPMIAISNGTKTFLFALDTNGSNYEINLALALPDSFYDTALTIKYIVGEAAEEYDPSGSNVLYTCYYYTEPLDSTSFTIEDENGDAVSTITVSKQSASSIYDYCSGTPAS